jgi:hypothetical protein
LRLLYHRINLLPSKSFQITAALKFNSFNSNKYLARPPPNTKTVSSAMSALVQKQTFQLHHLMSALPSKADVRHCNGSRGPECIAITPPDKLGVSRASSVVLVTLRRLGPSLTGVANAEMVKAALPEAFY